MFKQPKSQTQQIDTVKKFERNIASEADAFTKQS